MSLPSAGLHFGVPFETYREWPAANISTIKPIRKTPMHCRWEMEHPRESDEMDVGSATHVSILEPGRLEREFYFGTEEYRLNTKEGKEIHAKELERAAGRKYIRRMKSDAAVDADDVRGMCESVWKFKAPRKFLEMAGSTEVSALWKDPETGLMCKGRFDKLCAVNKPVILEIKTTRDASGFSFGKQCAELGYATQAAYYQWGHQILTGITPLHTILAVENKGPWAPKMWTFSDRDLATGAFQFRMWLNHFADCQRAGQWPGYEDKVGILEMPGWAQEAA